MEEEEKKEVEAWEEEFPHNKPRASLFLCVGVGPTLPRAAHRDCSVCAIHCLEWFGFRSFSPLPLPSPLPLFYRFGMSFRPMFWRLLRDIFRAKTIRCEAEYRSLYAPQNRAFETDAEPAESSATAASDAAERYHNWVKRLTRK